MKKYGVVCIVLAVCPWVFAADVSEKKDWKQIYLPETTKTAKPAAADKPCSLNRQILEPITKAGLKEMFASRVKALDKLYKDGRWYLYPKCLDRDVRAQSNVMMLYAVDYKFSGRKENLAKIASSFNWVYDKHWDKGNNVLFNGHYYLPNAIWAVFMAIILEEVGGELPTDLKLEMESTLRGSADLCAVRSTGGKPSNTVVCNQDFWAAHGLLLAGEYLEEEKYKKAAMKKLGYISRFEQQGFECEFGVGPLYQGVGRPGCAELGHRLWDKLNYRGKCMLLDTGLVHLIATTSTTGQRRLGIENQRSSGFPGGLSPCFLPAAIKQKNPMLTWSALKTYHRNQKQAYSKWWLYDPVGALCTYQFYKYGLELDAKNQEQWIISWGAKARLSAPKGGYSDGKITDEQSYIRSRTGLTAHFADRRLSSGKARKDIQWNPGGLRHLAREDDVIVAPDNKLSKPRLIFADMEQADSEYIGSEMYRGVFASQYVLRQTLLAVLGKNATPEKLINASHTFIALDDLFIVKLRYAPLADIKKDSAYRIAHLRSKEDKMDKKGRYVLSRLATSVGGAKPGQHALVSLDGQKIFTSATPQTPKSAGIIKDSLSDWGVPFSQWKKGVQQTRLIAIKPFANKAETEQLLASMELPTETGCQNTLEAMALKNSGKKYYLVTGAKDAVVKFKGHEFKITGSTPEIINVFAFDDSGKLDGFSVYGTQCCVDGVKLFDAKKPSYVSLTDLDGRYYASSDQSAARVTLFVKHSSQWSLVTGKPAEAIRNGEILVGKHPQKR